MQKRRTPNLMFPVFRARVDTGRPKVAFRSGCRGFVGLVPQPLCMKSKVCSEEQTCKRDYKESKFSSSEKPDVTGTGLTKWRNVPRGTFCDYHVVRI
jgi:hypothetical protein